MLCFRRSWFNKRVFAFLWPLETPVISSLPWPCWSLMMMGVHMWMVSLNPFTQKVSKNKHGVQFVSYFLISKRSLRFDLEGLFYGLGICVYVIFLNVGEGFGCKT